MPRCPKCRRSFRTLPDEEGMHDCPHCGFGEPVDHTHLHGESIYHEGRFIGTVQKQKSGTWCADCWLAWGNSTLAGAASREYAVNFLIEHDASEQRRKASA